MANRTLCPGLTFDDPNLYDERIKLWNDFNHAWLAMFQRQKDMMKSGHQLQREQTLVPQEGLQKDGQGPGEALRQHRAARARRLSIRGLGRADHCQ